MNAPLINSGFAARAAGAEWSPFHHLSARPSTIHEFKIPYDLPDENELRQRYERSLRARQDLKRIDQQQRAKREEQAEQERAESEAQERPRPPHLLELSSELLHLILMYLPRDSIMALCLTSRLAREIAQPYMYRRINPEEWHRFLELFCTLSTAADGSWQGKAASLCRNIELSIGCTAGNAAPDCGERRHRDRGERDHIASQSQDALIKLLRKAIRVERLAWNFCKPPNDLSPLFASLARHPIKHLRLNHTCEERPRISRLTDDALYQYKEPHGRVPLFRIPGWQSVVGLERLTSLDLRASFERQVTAYVISADLEDLLSKCPSLTSLRLHFFAANPMHDGWVLLSRLDDYHWPALELLDLDHAAAPSRLALRRFLERHPALEVLKWCGPAWADLCCDLYPNPDAGGVPYVGAFTSDSGDTIQLPTLKEISVTSMRLLTSILDGSSPASVHHAIFDLRTRANAPRMVVDGENESDLVYTEVDPLPCLSKCTALRELSLTIRGSVKDHLWEQSRLARALKELPSSLAILTIHMPDIIAEQLPLQLPLDALSHLVGLRLLALPHEMLFSKPRFAQGVTRPSSNPRDNRAQLNREQIEARDRFSLLCDELAKLPRLDLGYFIGSQMKDACDTPTWNLSLEWESLRWSAYRCFSFSITRTTTPPPPPISYEADKHHHTDRLVRWLRVLDHLVSIRHGIYMRDHHRHIMEEREAARLDAEIAAECFGKPVVYPEVKDPGYDIRKEVSCVCRGHCRMNEHHPWKRRESPGWSAFTENDCVECEVVQDYWRGDFTDRSGYEWSAMGMDWMHRPRGEGPMWETDEGDVPWIFK